MGRGRTSDRDRILSLLANAGGGLSNLRVKSTLGMADDRYNAIREELIGDELLEKYTCRGGGIRLTRKGEKDTAEDAGAGESSVERERDLYEPLIEVLEGQAAEDEIPALVVNTSALRSRGKWQNPDVTRITFETYPTLRKRVVLVTTYEVKQWLRWDVTAVFEAKSHDRFANQAWVVLEWAKDVELSDSDHGVDQILRECRRFGVGLAFLRPHYAKFRVEVWQEPIPQSPQDPDVEYWLEYMLSRNPNKADRFEALMKETDPWRTRSRRRGDPDS